jgi:hypothetical protein
MSLRCYVAASSAEIPRARAMEQALREAGIEVVSRWIESVEAVGEANPRLATRVQRAEWAWLCLSAIESADVTWLLAPEPGGHSDGAFCELGYTHAKSIEDASGHDYPRWLICSGDTKRSIFCALADHEFDTDAEALAWLVERAGVQR